MNDLNPLFWGIVAESTFSTIVIDSDIDSGYGVDQVTYGSVSVPEPGSMVLIGLAC